MQSQQVLTNTMLNRFLKLSKTFILFTLVFMLSVTSLFTPLLPKAMAYPGELDVTFNAGGIGFDGAVRKTIVQNDGKIIVTGGFSNYNSTPANRIIRLNYDGSVDNSFVYGGGFNHGA